MIHRLSILGGALCGSSDVPKTAVLNPAHGMEVWGTLEAPSGDCYWCDVEYRKAHARPFIVSLEIQCPRCNRYHVDREEWYYRPHHTHLCEHCGNEWDLVEQYVRGIEPVSLKGRLRSLKHAFADYLYKVLTGVTTKR